MPRENPELFTKVSQGNRSSRFVVTRRRLWKFNEIVSFERHIREDALADTRGNSLVIHNLVALQNRRNERVARAIFVH
jgi:hypothetical protein